MLTKLIMKNFKSFMEKTEIDFNATGYEILNENNKTENNILKGALIVGGNATGKSTVLEAIRFLLELLVWQVNLRPLNYVCLFKNSVGRMILEYEFVINQSKIEYKIECDSNRIFKENLLVDGKERLSRMKDTAEYTDIQDKKIEINNLQNNQAGIRKVYFDTKFIDDDVLKSWFDFLENSIYIDQSKKVIYKSVGSASQIEDYFEKNGTEAFNNFLEKLDYQQYIDYTNDYNNGRVRFKFENDHKAIIVRRKDMEFGVPLNMESEGNKTLINTVPEILDTMKHNAMIIIDEFSSGFHNILEEKIIRYFMKNSKHSQLFLVSHSTNLLTNTLLRPDQIYTVDFEKNKGSKINRVSDSKPREAQNLEKMYLSGVFNGIPNTKQES